jgi:hypothetical protein
VYAAVKASNGENYKYPLKFHSQITKFQPHQKSSPGGVAKLFGAKEKTQKQSQLKNQNYEH